MKYLILNRFRHIAALDPYRLQSTPDEHLDILEAAKQHDAAQAEEKLTNHLENVKKSTEAAFGLIFPWDTLRIFFFSIPRFFAF